MIGMLQIITYLLCIYLVFRGADILQIAISSSKTNHQGGIALGFVALIISIAGAMYFAIWVDQFAAEISNTMAQIPGPGMR